MKKLKLIGRNYFLVTHYVIKHFFIILFKNYDASINGINKKLDKYLNFRDGFFVELGANDGLSQSNTFYLEKKLGWRGILIEPSIKKLNLAKKFRHRSTLVNCFCSNKTTEAITLFDNDLESSVSNKQGNIKISAPEKKITDILIENKAPKKINFFSLDVEGHEYEVIEGLDLNLFFVEVFLIEIRSKTLLNKISYLLGAKGYKLIKKITIHDYVFMKQ